MAKEKKESEYVQIDMKIITKGIIAGVIASLWTIIPFFVGGVSNLIYGTVSIGSLYLLFFVGFNKRKLVQSVGLALGTFLVISYFLVPFATGFFVDSDLDTLQYEAGEYSTVNLALPGLFCQGCAYSTQNALKGIPGVADAQVSFNDKEGVVIYDPEKVSPEEIVENDIVQAYGGQIKK